MMGNLSSPSKNAYSRWDGKSLSSRSGGSSHEDLIFSGTLISQTGDGGRFGSLLITLNNSSRYVVPTGRVIATVSIKVPTGRVIATVSIKVPTG
ncbi:hypothetical protein Tco_1381138, partial [Tanacetum coccineum]